MEYVVETIYPVTELYSFNYIPPLIFWDAHKPLVKHPDLALKYTLY